MWKKVVNFLVPFLAVVETQSQCNCYEEQNLTALSAVITNAYNTTTFSACYSNPCSFSVFSGDDSFVWSDLIIHWVKTTNSGGSIQIFDGTSDSGTPIIEIPEGGDVKDGDEKNRITSKSARVFIKYTQSGTKPNEYLGSIQAVPSI